MENIDVLRDKLHAAIDKGNAKKALEISQRLDIEIVNYTADTFAKQETLFKGNMSFK